VLMPQGGAGRVDPDQEPALVSPSALGRQ
jgi:hypothetical protein